MNFDQAKSILVGGLTWFESFATTPREKIDLEGMAALARLAGAVKATLAAPENATDLARVGAMAVQDMPSLVTSAADPGPVDPPSSEQPSHQSPQGFNQWQAEHPAK